MATRTLIYTRVSTEKQEKEATAESQEREAREYAASRDLDVVCVAHEQHTGFEFWQRPILQQQLDRIRAKEYDAVIVHSVDRLSRRMGHLFIFLEDCERAGAKLHFVSESFDDTPEGRLLLSVKAYVAEIEREKIRERGTRGKRQRVHRGLMINASTPLYGYTQDKETSARAIKTDEAEIVRQIWDTAFLGYGTLAIARRLNSANVPSPGVGKRVFKDGRTPQWGKTSVMRILREPAYAGLSVALRWLHSKENGKQTVKQRPRNEWTILSDSLTPAIVSQEEFDQMQELVSARRCGDSARNETMPVLLRGLIFCLKCSRRRVPDPASYAYRCASRHSGTGTCGSGSTNMRRIEDWVWAEVMEILSDPDQFEADIRQMFNERISDKDGLSKNLDQTETRIAKITTGMRSLVARFTDADDSILEMVESQVKQQGQQLKALQAERASLMAQIAAADAEQFQFEWLAELCRSIGGATEFSIDLKRKILSALRVTVWTDGNSEWKIVIDRKMPGGDGCDMGNSRSAGHNISMLWAEHLG